MLDVARELLRARRFQYFHTSQPRSAYLRLNMNPSAALRPTHEVEDENDEQNDHEDADQSITSTCDGEHVCLLFVECQTQIPIAT